MVPAIGVSSPTGMFTGVNLFLRCPLSQLCSPPVAMISMRSSIVFLLCPSKGRDRLRSLWSKVSQRRNQSSVVPSLGRWSVFSLFVVGGTQETEIVLRSSFLCCSRSSRTAAGYLSNLLRKRGARPRRSRSSGASVVVQVETESGKYPLGHLADEVKVVCVGGDANTFSSRVTRFTRHLSGKGGMDRVARGWPARVWMVPLSFFDVSFRPRFLCHEFNMRSSRLDDCADDCSRWLQKLSGTPCERLRTARTRLCRLVSYQGFRERLGVN